MARPMGEISQALLAAAQQGPGTLRELAARSQVGWEAARHTLPNLSRAGALRVVDERHVAYRNRLVHVYDLPARCAPLRGEPVPTVDVAPVMLLDCWAATD